MQRCCLLVWVCWSEVITLLQIGGFGSAEGGFRFQVRGDWECGGAQRIRGGGEVLRGANGKALGQGSWCIPKPLTSDQALMNNINFTCGIAM
ncbi:unnamed protein product, partial [Ilex paraguariensis]